MAKKKSKSKKKSKKTKAVKAEALDEKQANEEVGRLVFEAAAKSDEYFDHLQAHYRECKRKDVDIDAEIGIILADGSRVAEGTAKVMNVSPSGALLGAVKLSAGGIPTEGFTLELKMVSGGYEGIQFQCKPIRLVPEHAGMGVKFEEIFVSL